MKKLYTIVVTTIILSSCGSKNNLSVEVKDIPVTYPKTKKDTSIVDNYFGSLIKDPYRWLENDTSEETKSWVEAQNKVTFGYLNEISYRSSIKKRLTEIWNFPKYSAPFKEGGYLFYFKNDGLQNQSILYYQMSDNEDGKVLIDPNTLSKEGTTSISGFSVSKDGKYAAYSLSEGGSDWQKILVMTLSDKKNTTDEINWVKFSGISWFKDGFFYSRFPEPKGSELSSANENQKVYYHKIGTPQSADLLVYEDKTNPKHGNYAYVTDDDKWLVVSSTTGTYGNNLKIKNIESGLGAPLITVIEDFNNESSVIDSDGDFIYLMTNIDADKYKIVKVDSKNPAREKWITIIPEDKNVMTGVSVVGNKFTITYIKDASSLVKVFDREGKYLTDVKLPTMGTVSGFGGKRTDVETYYTFTSFAYPTTIFKYNVETNTSTQYRKSEAKFNPDDYEVKQEFYKSKDGTPIPMFIVHKKGLKLDGHNPTLLYGYGGFDISIMPAFNIQNIVFLEKGGVYAVANLRGGGEYGQEWHKAGMLEKKQNVFDDFISAAEFLIEKKYTNNQKLAIHGRSNGGLLVGACMTQRPDLFKVALPAVGVLDMLRYHKFTIGYAWAVEYGSSDDSTHFKHLIKYSPLHNVKEVSYPATMVLTADHDDRVVPAHSFKFAATLQEKHKGKTPVLIRIDTNAGHGAGKSTTMAIDEWTDIWAFTMYNLGMKYE